MILIDDIIFDVDGTLLDGTKDIARAVNFTLTELGLPKKPTELIISYIGTGVRVLLARSADSKDNRLIDKAVAVFSRYYENHITGGTRLYPHIKQTLEYLKNKRMFVITNRFKRSADVVLRKKGIRKYFLEILGADDMRCMKPSNCIVDLLAARLEINRDKTMIVGDMDIDIKTGKNSKIKTCWVSYGLGKREDVQPLKPDFMIDDILELRDIIL